MKKLLAILLMLALMFTMAACGGSEEAAEDVQSGAAQETPDLDVLAETDQLAVRMGERELKTGDQIEIGMGGAFLEVLYAGEQVTDYEFVVEGDGCVSAAEWDGVVFRVDGVKNGTCNLVVIRGEEKAVFPVTADGIPEVLALNWIGCIVYGAGETGDGVFGTPGLDDDIIVLYNGEPITDYTYTVADESLAEVTKNADGTLHIKALKEREVLEFLTIEYNGASEIFGLCV